MIPQCVSQGFPEKQKQWDFAHVCARALTHTRTCTYALVRAAVHAPSSVREMARQDLGDTWRVSSPRGASISVRV